MESISWLVKVSLPSYLQSLPIPNTLSGFQKLSGGDFISLIFFTVVTLTIIYATAKLLLPRRKQPVPLVNRKVKKDNPKVVDVVDIEDIHEEKVLYCRCWKSEKFPYCDGSHNKHNEESKDNVGPLILKRLEK